MRKRKKDAPFAAPDPAPLYVKDPTPLYLRLAGGGVVVVPPRDEPAPREIPHAPDAPKRRRSRRPKKFDPSALAKIIAG